MLPLRTKFGIKKELFCAKNKNQNSMQSAHNKIVDKIKKSKRGKIFFQKDFTRFGTGNAVRHTLSRLCQDGVILRLSALFKLAYFGEHHLNKNIKHPKHCMDVYTYLTIISTFSAA
ncbi:MAG: DUF6088 family protein [Prevotellaceae bacterium]|jgi:hypothetical protein|nr:DUF6088 family protein [Prevotellaceae bacterium]